MLTKFMLLPFKASTNSVRRQRRMAQKFSGYFPILTFHDGYVYLMIVTWGHLSTFRLHLLKQAFNIIQVLMFMSRRWQWSLQFFLFIIIPSKANYGGNFHRIATACHSKERLGSNTINIELETCQFWQIVHCVMCSSILCYLNKEAINIAKN